MVGRMIPPTPISQDIPVPIRGTSEYLMLHGKGELRCQSADFRIGRLSWNIQVGLIYDKDL